MSIKTDAQVIRDETVAGANTATRVGGNLVAIADDLIAKQLEIDANTNKVGVTTQISNLVEDTTPQLGGDLDLNGKEINGYGNVNYENQVSSLEKALNVYNLAQQGLGGEPTAVVIHHYTDGNLAQFDNVGSGDILRLVNAQNSIKRADQAADFVGTGVFLRLITTPVGVGSSQQTLMYINNAGHFQYPRASDYFEVNLNKTPDSNYAFRFMCNNDQVNLVNFDNRFKVQQESASNVAFVSDRGMRFYTNSGTNTLTLSNINIIASLPVYFNSGESRVQNGASLSIRDGSVLKIGDGNDWQMSHDGTDNNINLYNGDLVIRQNTTEKIRFERTTGKINAVDCNLNIEY